MVQVHGAHGSTQIVLTLPQPTAVLGSHHAKYCHMCPTYECVHSYIALHCCGAMLGAMAHVCTHNHINNSSRCLAENYCACACHIVKLLQ